MSDCLPCTLVDPGLGHEKVGRAGLKVSHNYISLLGVEGLEFVQSMPFYCVLVTEKVLSIYKTIQGH